MDFKPHQLYRLRKEKVKMKNWKRIQTKFFLKVTSKRTSSLWPSKDVRRALVYNMPNTPEGIA
jgi:hypothetical protein